MKTLVLRSLVIGGLLAAGPALALACDREPLASRTKDPETAKRGELNQGALVARPVRKGHDGV